MDAIALNQFETDGVVCIRQALSQDWLELLEAGVEAVIANPQDLCAICDIPTDRGKFFNGFFQSLAEPKLEKFVRESPVKDYAKAFNRASQLRFFYDQLLAKAPNTPQRTPWHSDRNYFPLQGNSILSIWIPLDPVSQDTGTMSFIRGSHRQAIETYVEACPQKESRDRQKGMYVLPDFEDYPEIYDIVS